MDAQDGLPAPRSGEADNSAPANASSRPSGYSSPSIVARRQRILEETRKLVGEVGLAGLSLDDVARRAGVAKRTIYNAFHSKEHLVATAINRFFEEYAAQVHYPSDPATLEGVLERLVGGARRIRSLRAFMRAMMNIYFASNVDLEIRRAIRSFAAHSHEPYVRQLQRARQLQDWVDADRLVEMLVCYRYATAHSWIEGLIAEADLERELARGCLTILSGSTRGKAHREIVATLCELDTNPLFTESGQA